MYLLVRGLSGFSGICQTDITREYHVKLLLFVLSTGTILKFNALPTNPILIAKFSFRSMFRSNIRFFLLNISKVSTVYGVSITMLILCYVLYLIIEKSIYHSNKINTVRYCIDSRENVLSLILSKMPFVSRFGFDNKKR